MKHDIFTLPYPKGSWAQTAFDRRAEKCRDLQLMCIKMTVILLKLCKSFWIKTSEKGFTEKHLEEIANQLLQLEQFKHLS